MGAGKVGVVHLGDIGGSEACLLTYLLYKLRDFIDPVTLETECVPSQPNFKREAFFFSIKK